MPVLKHAKKKLRKDKNLTLRNKTVRALFKKLIKKAKEDKTPAAVTAAVQAIDKAAKKNIIHKNKAARLKSALSKINSGQASTKTEKVPTVKKATAKKTVKKSSKAA